MSSLVSRMQPEDTKLPPEIYWRRRNIGEVELGECCATVLKTKQKPSRRGGPNTLGRADRRLGGSGHSLGSHFGDNRVLCPHWGRQVELAPSCHASSTWRRGIPSGPGQRHFTGILRLAD